MGYKLTQETREKIRLSKMGDKNPNFGKHFTKEHKEKLAASHIGRKLTPEHREKVIKTLRPVFKGIKSPFAGELHPNWRGGHLGYKKKQALARDDYTCQICGLRDIEIAEVDHIKPTALYPELENDLDNLMTVCPNCHARKSRREKSELKISVVNRKKWTWTQKVRTVLPDKP